MCPIKMILETLAITQAGTRKKIAIESDENDTGGAYMYEYQTAQFAYDTWYPTIEAALQAAYLIYGIKADDWVTKS